MDAVKQRALQALLDNDSDLRRALLEVLDTWIIDANEKCAAAMQSRSVEQAVDYAVEAKVYKHFLPRMETFVRNL